MKRSKIIERASSENMMAFFAPVRGLCRNLFMHSNRAREGGGGRQNFTPNQPTEGIQSVFQNRPQRQRAEEQSVYGRCGGVAGI
jgi:hypothetical protein